ncbi:MAG: DUF3261 domain-containing protein [Myxococcales bacterium]|nr:DUF3261 domain-containing protein [Myxococcales bacterium]MCB9708877.1 DUF3261 domain-containing protein [Myxococcales bacterium]
MTLLSRLRIFFLAGFLLTAHGCGGTAHPTTEHKVFLPPIIELGQDFVWRQRIVATHSRGTMSFGSVLEKRGTHLKLLGLTPFGTRAFLLEQDGSQMRYTAFTPQRLPFPPEYILHDVHRVFRISAGEPDGWHCQPSMGVRMCNYWRGHALFKRALFHNISAKGAFVTITYGAGYVTNRPPPRVKLVNHEHGYSLDITTLVK